MLICRLTVPPCARLSARTGLRWCPRRMPTRCSPGSTGSGCRRSAPAAVCARSSSASAWRPAPEPGCRVFGFGFRQGTPGSEPGASESPLRPAPELLLELLKLLPELLEHLLELLDLLGLLPQPPQRACIPPPCDLPPVVAALACRSAPR